MFKMQDVFDFKLSFFDANHLMTFFSWAEVFHIWSLSSFGLINWSQNPFPICPVLTTDFQSNLTEVEQKQECDSWLMMMQQPRSWKLGGRRYSWAETTLGKFTELQWTTHTSLTL